MKIAERKVDAHRRIYLPSEMLKEFSDGFAYFRYDSGNNAVVVMGLSGVHTLKKQIEQEYGEIKPSNQRANNATRDIGGSIYSSFVESEGRVVIPRNIARLCGICLGDNLEIAAEAGSWRLSKYGAAPIVHPSRAS